MCFSSIDSKASRELRSSQDSIREASLLEYFRPADRWREFRDDRLDLPCDILLNSFDCICFELQVLSSGTQEQTFDCMFPHQFGFARAITHGCS